MESRGEASALVRAGGGAPAPVEKKLDRVTQAIYYLGRFGQILGMWLLIVDVFTAGPAGPDPRLFGAGVAVFLAGWGLTRVVRRS
jgi:hypothetical protein